MKVCFVSPVPPPYGGIARWTLLLHQYIAKSESVEVVQVDTSVRWRKTYDQSPVKRAVGGMFQLIRDYSFFINALMQKPDIVHLTTSGGLGVFRDLVIAVTTQVFGIPLIYHIHFGRIPEIAAANTFEWRIMAQTMRMAGTIVSITKATTESISYLLPTVNIVTIPNPIDCAELPSLSEECGKRRIALFLGWIIPTKGVEELVQAWSELSFDEWDLLLVGPGDGEYRKRLLDRYRPQNLQFVGELKHNEAMKLMAQCDLFVLPSYSEGFPNVILEAMALSKPIIATSVGAVQDMLAGGCGVMIQPRNVEELKTAVTDLIRNKHIREKLGVAAYDKVLSEYSINIVFDQYIHLWQELVQKRVRNIDVL